MLIFKSLMLACLLAVCFWVASFDWKPNPYLPPERGLVEYEVFLERWIERGEEEFVSLGSASSLTREEVIKKWRDRGAEQFRQFDLNGDGVLDKKERLKMGSNRSQSTSGNS